MDEIQYIDPDPALTEKLLWRDISASVLIET